MPEHTFRGPLATDYPESRHSDGTWVGTVEPGEIRDTPEPLDGQWAAATDEDREALRAAGEEAAAKLAEEISIAADQLTAPDTPPLYPSSKPSARRKTTPDSDTAGQPGSKEG